MSEVYVKFTSHRARDYGFRALDREGIAYDRQGYYSWKRETGKGVYKLTPEAVAAMRGQHLVNFTVLRAPYDDLMLCW